MKLSDLQKHHKELTRFLFMLSYRKLKNKQSKDHWERVYDAIKDIIHYHGVDFSKFWKSLLLLQREVVLASKHTKNILTGSAINYSVELVNWFNALAATVEEKTNYTSIKMEDFNKFVSILTQQLLESYPEEKDFVTTVIAVRELTAKANEEKIKAEAERRAEIKNLQQNPQKRIQNEISLLTQIPIEILALILSLINNPKDLCNLERVSHFMKQRITTLNTWQHLVLNDSGNKKYSSFFEQVKKENPAANSKDTYKNAIKKYNHSKEISDCFSGYLPMFSSQSYPNDF